MALYTRTAGQIITAAYEDIGVLSDGQSPSTNQYTRGLTRLNFISKQFTGTADGAPGQKIYSRKRVAVFLSNGKHQYQIGLNQDRCTNIYGRTTLDAAEAASQTVLSVTATSDTTTTPGTTFQMQQGDVIGIEQNDDTVFWSTVSSFATADTVTITTGIDSAAASGNYVWWFRNYAEKFALLESAVLRDENLNDVPISVYTDAKQYELGVASKYADGTPTALLYEPFLSYSRITLDSQPTDLTQILILTVQNPGAHYDLQTDQMICSEEWFAAFEWEVAFRLAPAYRVKWTQTMQQNRDSALALARNANPENSVLFYEPNA